jgi:hypothetical protein
MNGNKMANITGDLLTEDAERRTLSKDYVELLCRRLLELRVYSADDIMDFQRLLQYLRDRKIEHGLTYKPGAGKYVATAVVPTTPPINLAAASKNPVFALSLCGARLAELAHL